MPDTYRIAATYHKWQFCCPRSYDTDAEHTNWFAIDGKFRCQTCQNNAVEDPDIDPETAFLIHRQSGQRVYRDQIDWDVDTLGPHATG